MSYSCEDRVPVDTLISQTFKSVKKHREEIHFTREDGSGFVMFHDQDCCERVDIEDIAGELKDLCGSPILHAEESSNSTDAAKSDWDESHTWTFYRLRTMKGSVVIRWYGTSNGYYSESVSLAKFQVMP